MKQPGAMHQQDGSKTHCVQGAAGAGCLADCGHICLGQYGLQQGLRQLLQTGLLLPAPSKASSLCAGSGHPSRFPRQHGRF